MHAGQLKASLQCAISPICSGWKRSLTSLSSYNKDGQNQCVSNEGTEQSQASAYPLSDRGGYGDPEKRQTNRTKAIHTR